MSKLHERVINEIRSKASYGIIIEVGGGSPVYNTLCQFPNTASKLDYYSESPNSWDYAQEKYGHKDVRAVSPEVCRNMLDYHYHQNVPGSCDYILVNSIQVANTKEVCSHGWFGYHDVVRDERYYFHYTIPVYVTRKHQLEIIAGIGLEIISTRGNVEQFTNRFVDDVRIGVAGQSARKTLTAMIHRSKSDPILASSVVFATNAKITRLNDLIRSHKDITVFKGSFNPIHPGHLEMIQKIEKEFPETKVVLSISLSNRDTSKNRSIAIDNLLKRIMLIHSYGYDVIIDSDGYYNASYNSFINNSDFTDDHTLRYMMGGDIINRFLNDEHINEYASYNQATMFNVKWRRTSFVYFDRAGIVSKVHPLISNVKRMEIMLDGLSSTAIRAAIDAKNYHIELQYAQDYLNRLKNYYIQS